MAKRAPDCAKPKAPDFSDQPPAAPSYSTPSPSAQSATSPSPQSLSAAPSDTTASRRKPGRATSRKQELDAKRSARRPLVDCQPVSEGKLSTKGKLPGLSTLAASGSLMPGQEQASGLGTNPQATQPKAPAPRQSPGTGLPREALGTGELRGARKSIYWSASRDSSRHAP